MQPPNFLNSLQQALLQFQSATSTLGASFSGTEAQFFGVLHYLETTALTFAVLALIFFIYIRLKLEGLEHALEHSRQEAELKYAGADEGERENEARRRFNRIVEFAHSSSESDWRRAILDADIMLGEILDERGYIGDDLSEKLRSVNRSQFPSIEAAWEAHRLRNVLAHVGEGFALTHREVLIAVDNYRRVFEEFGCW